MGFVTSRAQLTATSPGSAIAGREGSAAERVGGVTKFGGGPNLGGFDTQFRGSSQVGQLSFGSVSSVEVGRGCARSGPYQVGHRVLRLDFSGLGTGPKG